MRILQTGKMGRKIPRNNRYGELAAEEGFEPSHTESESAVLPLHNSAISLLRSREQQRYYNSFQKNVNPFFAGFSIFSENHF